MAMVYLMKLSTTTTCRAIKMLQKNDSNLDGGSASVLLSRNKNEKSARNPILLRYAENMPKISQRRSHDRYHYHDSSSTSLTKHI